MNLNCNKKTFDLYGFLFYTHKSNLFPTSSFFDAKTGAKLYQGLFFRQNVSMTPKSAPSVGVMYKYMAVEV